MLILLSTLPPTNPAGPPDSSVSTMPMVPRESYKGRLLRQTAPQGPALCGLREEHCVLFPSLSQQRIDLTLGKINVGKDRRNFLRHICHWGALKHTRIAVALTLLHSQHSRLLDQSTCGGQSGPWNVKVRAWSSGDNFPLHRDKDRPGAERSARGYTAGR